MCGGFEDLPRQVFWTLKPTKLDMVCLVSPSFTSISDLYKALIFISLKVLQAAMQHFCYVSQKGILFLFSPNTCSDGKGAEDTFKAGICRKNDQTPLDLPSAEFSSCASVCSIQDFSSNISSGNKESPVGLTQSFVISQPN